MIDRTCYCIDGDSESIPHPSYRRYGMDNSKLDRFFMDNQDLVVSPNGLCDEYERKGIGKNMD